ncbi:MAG TPA: RDD family protein [Streptosporangiaceae bacterium]|nr:RDD family protein [Streptosporangiaceae bacterium]
MSARPRPAGWVSLQGQYAGAASRFLAYLIDLVVSTAMFTLAVAGVSFVIETVTRHPITWTAESGAVTTAVFVAWEFFYFGYAWAASGKTVGMAMLGIRVVQADGTGADAWRGVVRALVFPFSFLFLGLGFIGLLVQGQRQALHDLVAGTVVVYAWDARAARLRVLAREAETGPAPAAQRTGRTG